MYNCSAVSKILIKFTFLPFFMLSFLIITFASLNMQINYYTSKYT